MLDDDQCAFCMKMIGTPEALIFSSRRWVSILCCDCADRIIDLAAQNIKSINSRECCGGACEAEGTVDYKFDWDMRDYIRQDDCHSIPEITPSADDPTFTVPLDLLESKSFDAIRID